MLKANVQEALNKQLNAELASSYLYLSMAAWFEEKKFRGMGHWMRVQAHEEWSHAMKFYGYIIERGGRVLLTQVSAPKTEWGCILEAFQDAYNHECQVTRWIHELNKLSIGESDYAAQTFLQWFITEQVEEEANAEQIVEKLKMVGESNVALLFLDSELGKRGRIIPASASQSLILNPQKDPKNMCTLVTKPAPDFTAKAVMPDNSFADLKLSSYRGKYVVLFFYPLDFTFVCPSEIIAFDKALASFKQKGAEVIGASVDSHYTHLAWKNTPRNQGGIGPINYPLVADLDKKISSAYGVLLEGGVALRGLFLIDKQGIIRHAVINDLPLGRNVDEALRMVEALQFHETHGEVCPANWREGEEGMKPNAKGVAEYLAKHAT